MEKILPIENEDQLAANIFERLRWFSVWPELTGIKEVTMDGTFVIYVTFTNGVIVQVVAEIPNEANARSQD